MIETVSLYRPGLTAIAAVLALSSTSAMAQLALPEVAAPAAPPVAAPAADPVAQTAPVQTVQSVPATPKLPDIAVAEAPATPAPARPQPAARQRAEAPAQTAPRQTAERQSVQAAPVAPAAAPMAASPAMQAEQARDAAPAPEAADPQAVTATSAEATASNDMGYAGWALLGGGLLIVAGGAAFAMSRRPKRRDEVVAYDVPATATVAAPAAPALAQPTVRQPVVHAKPVEAAPFVAPRAAREEPRRPRAAVMNQSIGDGAFDDRRALLEAMVAEAPTEANPFHSRRNRMRRADFLLRTGQADERGTMPSQQMREEPAMASDRWSEMRFGGKQNARISWKPVPNR